MKIIVVGIGKVGFTVADQLSNEHHDVTIVDTNEKVLNAVLNNLDVTELLARFSPRQALRKAILLSPSQEAMKSTCFAVCSQQNSEQTVQLHVSEITNIMRTFVL